MVSYDPKRAENLRIKCINLSVGRFMRTIDSVLQRHRDQGRDLEVEAAAIIREVILEISADELQDSAVFLIDDTPVPPGNPKKAWGEYDQPEDPSLELRDEPEEDKKVE